MFWTVSADAHARDASGSSAGIGGRWLDASTVRRVAGVDGAAAIRTRGNAQVGPFKAAPYFEPLAARFHMFNTYVLATRSLAQRALGEGVTRCGVISRGCTLRCHQSPSTMRGKASSYTKALCFGVFVFL